MIDQWVNTPKGTPIVFTSLGETTLYKPSKGEGGDPYQNPLFTFEYTIPLFGGDGPWKFTKTGKSGGVKDWNTPAKPDPPDPNPNNPINVDDPS